MPAVPIVGAVEAFFVDPPVIDFSLTGSIGGGVGVILNNFIQKIVAEQLGNTLVLPHKIFVPLAKDESIVPARTLMDAQFAPPRALLRVKLVAARNLEAADINLLSENSSDPCV